MALNGSVTIDATPNSCDLLVFSWEATQDPKANTSAINWTMNLVASEKYGLIYGVYAQKDWVVTIDGQETTGTADINIGYGETKTLATGTTVVNHEADGTKTIDFEFGINMDISGWGSKTETHECPDCDGTGLAGDGGECPVCDGSGSLTSTSEGVYIGWRRGSGTGELDALAKKFPLLDFVTGLIMARCSHRRAFPQREPIGYPTMAASYTWYKGTVDEGTIYEVEFVKDYTVTGNETESWAADVDGTGSIMCYRNDRLLTICSMGAEKIMANEDSNQMFRKLWHVYSVSGIDMLDTSAVKNMERMFSDMYLCDELDLSTLDTSSATNMCAMFGACFFKKLDISNFNTSNVTDMSMMFWGCVSLTELDLSSFDTSKAANMRGMFFRAYDLTAIYVGSGWTTENADTHQMFDECGVSSVTYV